jgi:hypothetical protein
VFSLFSLGKVCFLLVREEEDTTITILGGNSGAGLNLYTLAYPVEKKAQVGSDMDGS